MDVVTCLGINSDYTLTHSRIPQEPKLFAKSRQSSYSNSLRGTQNKNPQENEST